MIIREATLNDKLEIISLYKRSQLATGLPDPALIPPEELGDRLYARNAIGRYVAVDDQAIVGHGLIEPANQDHLSEWQRAIGASQSELIELGAAFVEPSKTGNGIWSALLAYRLDIVRRMGAIPVSVTWSVNEHVKSHFIKLGGNEIAQKITDAGDISIFVLR